VVVAGHARETLVRALGAARGLDVTVVDNPAYATTNTLASLLCAAPALRPRDFLLLDRDLLFEDGVLAALAGGGTRLAIAAGHALLAAGHAQAYYEAAFQRLLSDGAHVHAADVTGLRWVEIDDPADLRRAEALFAPVG
jgi:choline kinase